MSIINSSHNSRTLSGADYLVNIISNSQKSQNDYNSNPSDTVIVLVNVLNALHEELNIDTTDDSSFEMFLHAVMNLAQIN